MPEPMTDARLDEIEEARVRLVFDGPPESGRFVEAEELSSGRSIEIGEWFAINPPYWSLLIADPRPYPELISEIRRLREENERLRAEAGKLERERNASIAVCEGLSRTQGCPPMPPGSEQVEGVHDVERLEGGEGRDAVTDARGFLKSRNNPHESDAQLIRRLGACCGVLEQERDAALARAEKAEAEVEEWKSKATSYDYDRRDACAEVRRLTAERRADELAVKLDGTIVVRDDDETRDRIAQALMTRRAWSPETLSELDNSNQSNLQLAAMSLREDADAVLDALREAYQRGEQDSRGNPMPCLHLDEAAAVLAALREAYQRGEQDSRGNPMPCLHLDSIEERQNATDAAQEGGTK